MSTSERPNTTNLCGTFADLTDAESDQGRAYSAPIVQDCAIPDVTVDGEASLSYVDDEPVWTEGDDSGGEDVSGGVDVTITSVEDLAAVATTGITVGSAAAIKLWIDAETGVFQAWQLVAQTYAHDPAEGIVRPDDFDLTTNAKVWLKVSFP